MARAPVQEVATVGPISLRIPEAVRLTGLSRSRIYELIKSGEIDYAKVGNSTLILMDSLRAFIERKRKLKRRGLNKRVRDRPECWSSSPLSAGRLD